MIFCMSEGCDNEAKTRNLCVNCYSTLRVLVRKGQITWAELVHAGLCRPTYAELTPMAALIRKSKIHLRESQAFPAIDPDNEPPGPAPAPLPSEDEDDPNEIIPFETATVAVQEAEEEAGQVEEEEAAIAATLPPPPGPPPKVLSPLAQYRFDQKQRREDRKEEVRQIALKAMMSDDDEEPEGPEGPPPLAGQLGPEPTLTRPLAETEQILQARQTAKTVADEIAQTRAEAQTQAAYQAEQAAQDAEALASPPAQSVAQPAPPAALDEDDDGEDETPAQRNKRLQVQQKHLLAQRTRKLQELAVRYVCDDEGRPLDIHPDALHRGANLTEDQQIHNNQAHHDFREHVKEWYRLTGTPDPNAQNEAPADLGPQIKAPVLPGSLAPEPAQTPGTPTGQPAHPPVPGPPQGDVFFDPNAE